MQAVTASLGRLGLSSTRANRGAAVAPARGPAPVRATPLVAFAKQNAVQRVRLAEKARLFNKARKSEVATRIKKVRRGGEREEGRHQPRAVGRRGASRLSQPPAHAATHPSTCIVVSE